MPANRLKICVAVCATLSVVAISWYIRRKRNKKVALILKRIEEYEQAEALGDADGNQAYKNDVDSSKSDSDISSSEFSFTTATDGPTPSSSSTSLTEDDITTSYPSSTNDSGINNDNIELHFDDSTLNAGVDNSEQFYEMLSSPVIQRFDRLDGNSNNGRFCVNSSQVTGYSPISDVVHIYGDVPAVSPNSAETEVERRISQTLSVHQQFQCPP